MATIVFKKRSHTGKRSLTPRKHDAFYLLTL